MTDIKENTSGQGESREEMIEGIIKYAEKYGVTEKIGLSHILYIFSKNHFQSKKKWDRTELSIEAFKGKEDIDIIRKMVDNKGKQLYIDEQSMSTITKLYSII